MHKVEYKEYIKQDEEKEKGKDQVPGKYNGKAEAEKVAMQVIAALGDSSSYFNELEQ